MILPMSHAIQLLGRWWGTAEELGLVRLYCIDWGSVTTTNSTFVSWNSGAYGINTLNQVPQYWVQVLEPYSVEEVIRICRVAQEMSQPNFSKQEKT